MAPPTARRPDIPGPHRIFSRGPRFGFQLANVIATQIVDQLRTETGSSNPMIDEDKEPPVDIPPPVEKEQHTTLATQGSTTNALIKTMMVNMESMRICLEQADSWIANGGR